MKSLTTKSSLVALALLAAMGGAQAGKKSDTLMPTAQIDSSSEQIAAVRRFLAGGKNIAKLKMPRLQERLHRAENLRGTPGLPPDLDQALQQDIVQITREIERRQQQGAADQAPPDTQAQAQPEPQLEQPPLPPLDPQTTPDQPPAGSAKAAAFLQTVQPAASLSAADLRRQMQAAVRLSEASDLSQEQRQALRDVIRQARAALTAKQGETQQPPVAQKPTPQPPVAQTPVQPPPPVAQQPAAQPPATTTAQQPAPPATVDPALERRARAYLADTTDVSGMKRKQLRKRLADIRELLASNQLSPQTREALRQKLASERAVLRNEVAVDEGLPPPAQPPQTQQPGQQQPPPQTQPPKTGGNVRPPAGNSGTTGDTTDVRIVLQDRRPSNELDDRELVRRIDVYRDVVANDRYDAEQRMMWQRQMEDDRRYLRRQMIDERRQREARLRADQQDYGYNVEDAYDPRRDVPDDVFAAEADDSEIADVLAAPPRREIQRRYTLDDIERSPQVRDAVARIEIDTVHFGFGEGFLREEEIDKLDRIATVLEKILANHPDEIFLIEGHTDAVGSDAANLALSRQRALAVKEALTTYYVIPADNLKTVGLGERYLKIPTDQPEAENRRVSLARITALVGQVD